MSKLSTTENLILTIQKLNFNDHDKSVADDLLYKIHDWDYVVESVIRNGTGPLFHRNLSQLSNNNIVPVKVKSTFEQIYFKTLSRNILLYQHFRNIILAFSSQEIQVIALKGIYLAEKIYGDIGLRPLSDIDLLIQEKDIAKATDIMHQCGFSKNAFEKRLPNHEKDQGFYKGDILFELHKHIHPSYENFSVDIIDYWNRAQKIAIDGLDVFMLSPEDLLQHLCIHLFLHIRKGKFSFINFCDIDTLLKVWKNQPNWVLLMEINRKYNCTHEVGAILLLLNKYMSANIPEQLTSGNIYFRDKAFENRFINALKGNRHSQSEDSEVRITYFKNVKGLGNKLKYVLSELFPLKRFMIRRYIPRYHSFYIMYYPVRWVTSFLKMIFYLKKRK